MARLLHRWLGLALAIFLLFLGATGAFLNYANDIDRWLNPALNVPGTPASVPSFDRARAAARILAPDSRVIFIEKPQPARNSWRLVLDSALGERLYLHPDSYQLLLRRSAFAEPRDLTLALHAGLLGGEWLEMGLGVIGVLSLPLVLLGLWRWWPGWRRLHRGLRIRWRTARQFNFTAHRALGALLSVILLLIAVTGSSLSFHDSVYAVVSGMTGEPARPERPHSGSEYIGSELSLDALAHRAEERVAGAAARFVILPRKPGEVLSFRLRYDDEWHPGGRSEAWFHPLSGDLLGAYAVGERNDTQRALDGLYPLHIGAPLGALGKALWAATGLALAFFSASGVLIWWQRKGLAN